MREMKKKILFNILIILTIVFIYLLFFPKKSYVENVLKDKETPSIEETFNTNINIMKTAALNYFEKEEKEKVTVQELIDKELLVELKDSDNNPCDNNSYVEKEEKKLKINLKCNDKEDTVEQNIEEENDKKEKRDKLLCLYEYRKELENGYTEWSDWSEWSTEKIEEDEYTKVETKIEEEPDGTKMVTDQREISVDAIEHERLVCPSGYYEENGKCKSKKESNSITASISYSCPDGYTRSGLYCYSNGNKIEATKSYYCPTNMETIEFELVGNMCKTYNIKYINIDKKEKYYTCEDGYELSENKCYSYEEYEKEVENFKEVTYYRYQKREKSDKKYDIIWSTKDNKELLDKSYNISRIISCEF